MYPDPTVYSNQCRNIRIKFQTVLFHSAYFDKWTNLAKYQKHTSQVQVCCFQLLCIRSSVSDAQVILQLLLSIASNLILAMSCYIYVYYIIRNRKWLIIWDFTPKNYQINNTDKKSSRIPLSMKTVTVRCDISCVISILILLLLLSYSSPNYAHSKFQIV